MELGGKSPCVIFADADLDAAVDSALFGVMSLNGERCTAGSRILAERSVYDELVARLAERAARVRVGDPANPATQIGALVHPEHYERVMSYVSVGVGRGSAAGRGRVPAGRPGLAEGELPVGDRARGRDPVDAGFPGGDLRAGGVRDAVLRQSQRPSRWRTARNTGLPRTSGRRTCAARTGSPPPSNPG